MNLKLWLPDNCGLYEMRNRFSVYDLNYFKFITILFDPINAQILRTQVFSVKGKWCKNIQLILVKMLKTELGLVF